MRRYGGGALLVLLGGSGSGKSSLLRAGMLPRLRRSPGQWLVVAPALGMPADCRRTWSGLPAGSRLSPPTASPDR